MRSKNIHQEVVKNPIQEFLKNQKGFHQAMRELVEAVDSPLFQNLLSEKEKQKLERFLAPYRALINNPFADIANPESDDDIEITAKNIINIVDPDKKFEQTFSAILTCWKQYNEFLEILQKICKDKQTNLKKSVNTLSEEEEKIWSKLFKPSSDGKTIQIEDKEIIKPAQYSARYTLTLLEMKKNLLERKLQEVNSSNEKQNEFNNTLQTLEKNIEKINERLTSANEEIKTLQETPKPLFIIRFFKAILNFFKWLFSNTSSEEPEEIELQILVKPQDKKEDTSNTSMKKITEDLKSNDDKKEKTDPRKFSITSPELQTRRNSLKKQPKVVKGEDKQKLITSKVYSDEGTSSGKQKFQSSLMFFQLQERRAQLDLSSKKSIKDEIENIDTEIAAVKSYLEESEKGRIAFAV